MRRFLAVAALLMAAPAPARADAEADAYAKVEKLFANRCAIAACHGGGDPKQRMSLEPGKIYRNTVNVPARTDHNLVRISPGDPNGSLLYRKILPAAKGLYHGQRMPRLFTPLTEDEIELVRRWIESFPAAAWGEVDDRSAAAGAPAPTWSFHDGYLANLPTTEALGRKGFQFRVVHRFKPSAQEAGLDELFGIDGGANVSIGLGFGLSRGWEVGLRHSTLQQEEEVQLKFAALRQGKGSGISMSVVGSLAHQREDSTPNDTSAGLQIVLARRFGRHVSLLAVPMYVTRTNFLNEEDTGGTLALGLGGEWHVTPRYAIVGEWIGQLSGVDAGYQSGTLGFSIRTARHAFLLLASNTRGAHVDLYAPGGDLDWSDGDFRLGFNLSRTFTFR